MKRPPGLKDVAQLAGVSWKTVSNVVNGHPNVRPETRAKVQEAIEHLGYRPSATGRGLRGGRTNLLALAIPDLTSPYFASLSHQMIQAADARGRTLVITETGGRRERELEALRGLPGQAVDGVAISPLSLEPEDIAPLPSSRPVVFLGERLLDAVPVLVSIDNIASARELTRHLQDRGRRRLLFIGVDSGFGFPGEGERVSRNRPSTGLLRWIGCVRELDRHPDASLVALHVDAFTREEGARAVRAHLEDPDQGPFDAVLCANDLLALGALGELRRHGVDVPGQVFVAGWDDIPESRYSLPPLTTIRPDLAELARLTVDSLLRQALDPRSGTPVALRAGHRLVVRESTGTPVQDTGTDRDFPR